MPNVNPGYYRQLAKEFLSKKDKVHYFTNHGPTIGVYREKILSNLLKEILPKRFSVQSGFVYAKEGVVSKQIDILIIDENEPTSYFYKSDEFVIVHPDCVVCGIEVKSILRKKEFKESVENIKSLKELIPYSNYKKNFGGLIFSYTSPYLEPNRTDDWWKAIDNVKDYELYPNLILSLDRALITLRNNKDNLWGHYFVMGNDKKDYMASSLSVFLSTVQKYTELKANKQNNPFLNSLILPEQSWSLEYLRFGEGLKAPAK